MVNGKIYRQVTMAETTYHMYNHKVRDKTGSLTDHGANHGLVGTDICILNKTGCFVDVAGINNHRVTDLQLVTCLGLVATNKGPIRVAVMHQYAYLGHGKIIHRCGQLELYKNNYATSHSRWEESYKSKR